MIFGCPGSKGFKEPHPEIAKCKGCGAELEIWSDELSVICQKCGVAYCRKSGQSCLDWCPRAKECMGFKVDTKTQGHKDTS